MTILALNAGSSSLKFRLGEPGKTPIFWGAAQNFGAAGGKVEIKSGAGQTLLVERCTSLQDAAHVVLDRAQGHSLRTIGHRIVHGGRFITSHRVIDVGVRLALEQASALAPLHNPPALGVLDQAQKAFPDLSQVACLDTAFHVTMPPVATHLPIPAEYLGDGIRRYGFHGLSCESILAQLDPVPSRLVIAHVGGGASVTAVKEGRSVDTTMGLTPSGGTVMETRSGDLDPGFLIYLLRKGQTADTLEQMVNRNSGMAGTGGNDGDPRRLRNSAEGELALNMFTASIAKAIAGMATVLGGIDLLVLTGGIGEHDAEIRQAILDRLGWMRGLACKSLPAQEEAMILRHCAMLT